MQIKLDPWQKQVLETKGNLCLRSGRQVGKSTIISIKAAEYAIKHPNKTILMIASVERQAYLLFDKTLNYIMQNYRNYVKRGKDRPTKHKIIMKNGSVIHCLPTGLTGYGIRGYTINLLIADEAAFIPEEVWTAVTPMLAVTKGKIILLSTPHGREGYFYRCFNDEDFETFHVSSEECPRRDDKFLAKEKERMTKLQYAQEYLGEFIDELRQFFPSELITACCTGKRQDPCARNHYLGVDVARMGEDESTFEIIQKRDDYLIHVENQITEKTLTTETINNIIQLEKQWNFRKIYIDDAGVGAGIFDQLLFEESTRRKTIGINNARRIYERDSTGKDIKEKKKKLLKEELYDNLLKLMESGKIQLLDDNEVALSLKSIQYEYTDEGNIKIYGNYSHITEGLIRAAWCSKDKSLNILAFCK